MDSGQAPLALRVCGRRDKVKFYLDEDINPRVAEILSRLGCVATSTQGAGNRGADDEAQMAFAAHIGAAMVTRNRNDYLALTARLFDQGLPHHGIVIVPHSVPADDPAILAKLLHRLAASHPKGLAEYAVVFVRSPGK